MSVLCSFAREIVVKAGLCQPGSTMALQITGYINNWAIDPTSKPAAWPAWDGTLPNFYPNAFGPPSCTYQNDHMILPPLNTGLTVHGGIQDWEVNFLLASNGYPLWGLYWVFILSCANIAFGNNIVWTGKKLVVPGDDPTGIYTYDNAILGPTSDNRPQVQLEGFDTAP